MKIKHMITEKQITWLEKHVGPRLYWLPKEIGGQGWKTTKDKNGHWHIIFKNEDFYSLYVLEWN